MSYEHITLVILSKFSHTGTFIIASRSLSDTSSETIGILKLSTFVNVTVQTVEWAGATITFLPSLD